MVSDGRGPSRWSMRERRVAWQPSHPRPFCAPPAAVASPGRFRRLNFQRCCTTRTDQWARQSGEQSERREGGEEQSRLEEGEAMEKGEEESRGRCS